MKAVSITALMLATASPALCDPSVEVMHFWTSGGEAAALGAVRDKVVAEGVTWTDAPVAGGGGDQAKTALQARIGRQRAFWATLTPWPKRRAGTRPYRRR
jgi:glucose/mannose transport system substrate-binding protein